MSNCVPTGFGTGPFGTTPWAGSLVSDVGGPLPTAPPFDIYCVGPCGPISTILTHPEVSTIGDVATQFPVNGLTLDQEILSGGPVVATEASLLISDAVPVNFTLEFTFIAPSLPPNFTDLVDSHAYVAAFCPGGGCAGLFFSTAGISYTGSVHLDGSNNLVLDTPVQYLPGSEVLVSETDYWTVRIAESFSTGTVYLYVTKTAELPVTGHQLRYVLPAIPSSSAAVTPPDLTMLTMRGTLAAPTDFQLSSICLGTGVIIPGIPPVANAGLDQAIQLCSILQLDGSSSFDPQGAALTYLWQLLDAPPSSQFIYGEVDAVTYPGSPPTGYTNRLYSASLGLLYESQALILSPALPDWTGDVIMLGGTPSTIIATGTDLDGFYVQVSQYVLPDNLVGSTAFNYLPQNGLDTATSVKPTFYPDVAGIYKFTLTVYDGSFYSEPSEVIANVVESSVAHGVVPDVSFLWNYLSNFWSLVEDTDRITVFWQGLAQVASAELLRLWQVDYNKSLRDIQRTFQRKWLHYDLLMQENPNLIEVTTVRAVLNGLLSVEITGSIAGVSGTHLDLQLSALSTPTVISFTGADPYAPAALQTSIQAVLSQLDSRIVVRVITNRAGSVSRVRIDAPYSIKVLDTSTCPAFDTGAASGAPHGTGGAAIVSPNVYRTPGSLQYFDIRLNDFLCIDGVGYRIVRVVDDPSDPWLYQRLILADALPVPAGADWYIAGTVTSQDLNFWNGLCEQSDRVIYEVINNTTHAISTVEGVVLGASELTPSSLPVDATAVSAYLANSNYSVYLQGVLRRRYVPIDPLLVDVPLLQERIVNPDDTAVLRRNVDYFFDTFRGDPCLRFVTPVPAGSGGPNVWQGKDPPAQLWAEYSYLDNRPVIEQNFGIPANFTLADLELLPQNVDYLGAVRGLWYAYWNGPTLYDVRVGTQILLGLPFAEEPGTIVSIRSDFSVTTGQILVQDTANPAIVREYTFPPVLPMETNPATGKPYAVGDTVALFAPLVQGVKVVDYVKDPTWFAGFLQQGSFKEVQKYFTFMVVVESPAFNLSAILFAQSFVNRIRPTHTYPVFVVDEQLGNTGDTEVSVTDLVTGGMHLVLFDGAVTDPALGMSTMLDQPHAASGGWRNQLDASTVPTLPLDYESYGITSLNGVDSRLSFTGVDAPVGWGGDKMYLAPEDAIAVTLGPLAGPIANTLATQTASSTDVYTPPYNAPPLPAFSVTTPLYGSFFDVNFPVYSGKAATFVGGARSFLSTTYTQLGDEQVVTTTGTLNVLSFSLMATDVGALTYDIQLVKNGTPVSTHTVTPVLDYGSPSTAPFGRFHVKETISVAVTSGDVLTFFIRTTPPGGPPYTQGYVVLWSSLLVTTGISVDFSGGSLPSGTYYTYRAA